MKIIPSKKLLAHLEEQNVIMPEGGFDIPDGDYASEQELLKAVHSGESDEDFNERIEYRMIWKFHGIQQNGGATGAELQGVQKTAALTRQLVQIADSHLPSAVTAISQAVEDSSKVIHHALAQGHAKVESAILDLKRFEGESHAEVIKIKSELHADMMEVAKRGIKIMAGMLGIIAALIVLLCLLSGRSHAQIDVIKFQDSSGTALGTVAAPFTLKAGANCTWTKSGAIWVINCTGGAGGSMTWPATPGIAVCTGTPCTAWTTSLTAPAGAIVGTSDTQVLTNKDLTGVGNTFPTFNQNTTGSAAKWTTARNLAGNSVDGSGNVAFANKFIAQGTADSGLSGAQFLGALATCVLKNTTTTGVLSCAVGSDIPTIAESQVTNLTTDLAAKASSTAATTVNGVSCALSSTCTVADSTKVPTTTTVNGHALSANVTVTASDVSLGSVTNDAQTKAAVMPNTAPSAGQIPIGNAGGTAYAPLSLSQDCTIASTGAITCTKTNNVAFAASATTDTTNAANISSGALPAGRLPAFTGDMTTSIGTVATTVAKVNGIAYSGTAAAHSVEVITTANTTATAKVIPDCADATGNHLNYTQSTDSFSCGTSDSHVGTVTSVSGTTSELASTGGTTPVLSIASVFDVHGKTSTAPIKAGITAAAPATCQANIELYIKTDATAGQQVFICNGTGNGWNLVGDGGGAGGGVNDPGANGVMVRTALNTTTARTITGTANQITVTNGDGVAGAPTLAIASPLTLPGETTFAAATTGAAAYNIPSGTAPTTPSAGDVWIDTAEEKHVVAAATQGVVNLYNSAGTFANGLTSAPTAARTATFPDVTGTVGVIVASGTSTFTTTAVAASACQTTVTTSATGALSTDNFIWSYASAPTAATDGRLTIQPYVTANNVNFMRCNNTAASVTPTAIVVNWSVIRRP